MRMLRLVSCLVLLITAFPSFALARVRPGVEVGLNLSSLSYDDYDEDEFPFSAWDRQWRTSFTGGATVEIPVGGRFALLTGLRYVQQGNRIEYDTGPEYERVVGEFRMVQNYLSVPVLLECRPLPSRRFFFSLGPEVSLLLSARLVTEESIPEERTAYDDVKDQLNGANLTLDAGAGVEFPMENHVGVVSLRYTHGLTGVAKEDDWGSDWKTRGIECLVGMRW